MSRDEMSARGWRELDVLLITGDAYFDHPAHGAAIIGRVLERAGYRVGLIAQPDWRDSEELLQLGRPALFVGVTAGAVDSQVNNFTGVGRRRRTDVYAPGGRAGVRPDFATLVYANRAREVFGKLPVVLGGIEASFRRFAYFDPVKKRIRRSVLIDSRADILVWGPGEQQALEIANRFAVGRSLEGIPGTARVVSRDAALSHRAVELPAFDDVEQDPRALVTQALAVERSGRPLFTRPMFQRYREGIVYAEPRAKETQDELDSYYALDFTRDAHPRYREPIPALKVVRWSIVSHRGCPGGCSFCGLSMHQGREVVSRSMTSILDEAARVASNASFRGTITDVGGPTANAYGLTHLEPEACTKCRRPSCLHPRICHHLTTHHDSLLGGLEQMRVLKRVRHVFIASGLRHDLALSDRRFIEELARHYTGGHLKVAPEHVAPKVLELMRKPKIEILEQFESVFLTASRFAGKRQYLVPYFIAAFPGCRPADADAVGHWLQKRGQRLKQVQIFVPIAGTVAAAFYASRTDTKGSRIYVADLREAKRQKEIMHRGTPASFNHKNARHLKKF